MAQITSIPGLDAALANIAAGSLDGRDPDANGVRGTYAELPFDREFRVEIESAETRVSQAGNHGLRYVLVVTDDPSNADVTGAQDFPGSKVWGSVYFTGHEFQGQQLATLLQSAGATYDGNLETAAANIVGGKLVIALKPGNDPRYPDVRWLKLDHGQKIQTSGIKPPKGQGGSSAALTATPPIPVVAPPAAAPAPAAVPPVVAPPAAAPAPTEARPSGIRLPGA